ncbi:MAG: hypothetical protein ACP5G1_01590 [Nanopusillaceae archaeon]
MAKIEKPSIIGIIIITIFVVGYFLFSKTFQQIRGVRYEKVKTPYGEVKYEVRIPTMYVKGSFEIGCMDIWIKKWCWLVDKSVKIETVELRYTKPLFEIFKPKIPTLAIWTDPAIITTKLKLISPSGNVYEYVDMKEVKFYDPGKYTTEFTTDFLNEEGRWQVTLIVIEHREGKELRDSTIVDVRFQKIPVGT